MRSKESGFAMLFVLLMAAMVAITMYMALPRAAFESQREKEQTLVDRGNQYKRAIQLYVRANKRWPAKIEDLEDTNGKRFLRKRYLDPMTGKDEWRLIHVGPNGVLTDSLIKPPKKDDKSTFNNTFITELGGVQALPDGTTTPGNPGLRRRPSDSTPGGPPDGSSQPFPTQPGQPPPPGTVTVAGVNQPTQTGQPGQPGLPQQLQGNTGTGVTAPPTSTTFGGITALGGVGSGGYSTAPGANGPVPPPNQPGINPAVPGQTPNGQTPPGAAQLIQGLLTTPRPGGAPGTPNSGTGGLVQGGGIAGIATKYEGDSIKSYNDQTKYQLWEFVYDMSKDTMVTGNQSQLPQQQQNQNGATPNGTSIPTGTPPATVH